MTRDGSWSKIPPFCRPLLSGNHRWKSSRGSAQNNHRILNQNFPIQNHEAVPKTTGALKTPDGEWQDSNPAAKAWFEKPERDKLALGSRLRQKSSKGCTSQQMWIRWTSPLNGAALLFPWRQLFLARESMEHAYTMKQWSFSMTLIHELMSI